MAWVKWGAGLMFLAVALGAFGAHALRGKIDDHYLDVYKTAVMYHMFHALALFVVAWASTVSKSPNIQIAGYCFLAGVLLFSGSLYALSVTSIKWLGAITPLGGLSFLAGWALLFGDLV